MNTDGMNYLKVKVRSIEIIDEFRNEVHTTFAQYREGLTTKLELQCFIGLHTLALEDRLAKELKNI